MDLGSSIKSGGLPAVEPPEQGEIIYPQLGLHDEAASEFRKDHPDFEVGSEFVATVKCRVCAIRSEKSRYSEGEEVTLEVHAMDGIKANSEDPKSDESDDDSEPDNPAMRKLMAKQQKQ